MSAHWIQAIARGGPCATRGIEQAEPVATYGRGRICAHDGCHTRLSRYNSGDFCCIHADEEWDPRTVAMDYTKDGLRMCAECGRLFPPVLRCWYSDAKSRDGLSAACVSCLNPERGEHERLTQNRARRKFRAKKKEVAT